MLLIAWKMKAATMCVFTRDEFTTGMREMRCDSIEALKTRFPDLKKMLESRENFRSYYTFCFTFAKDVRAPRVCAASWQGALALTPTRRLSCVAAGSCCAHAANRGGHSNVAAHPRRPHAASGRVE